MGAGVGALVGAGGAGAAVGVGVGEGLTATGVPPATTVPAKLGGAVTEAKLPVGVAPVSRMKVPVLGGVGENGRICSDPPSWIAPNTPSWSYSVPAVGPPISIRRVPPAVCVKSPSMVRMPGDMPGAAMPELTRLPLSLPVPRTVPRLVSVLALRPALEGVPMLRIGARVGCGTAPISITPLLVLKFTSTSSPACTETVPEFWFRLTVWTPEDVFLSKPPLVKPLVEIGAESVPVSSIVPVLPLVSCPLVNKVPEPPTVRASWLFQLPSTLTAPPTVTGPAPTVTMLPSPPLVPILTGAGGGLQAVSQL